MFKYKTFDEGDGFSSFSIDLERTIKVIVIYIMIHRPLKVQGKKGWILKLWVSKVVNVKVVLKD